MKKRILTGDRPTGRLHLGHYVGSLKNRIRLQEEYECYFIIADLHTLTTQPEKTNDLKDNIRELVLDYLAVGIDPAKATIYLQSAIPEVAELAVIFGNLVSVPRLERMPTLKDVMRDAHIKIPSYGLLGYPVLQAADILMVKADLVPVGRDQESHIEITREIAGRFNNNYGSPSTSSGQIFPLPVALVPKDFGTLPGTDGKAKMSKSAGNVINLSDSAGEVKKKVMAMYTDPQRVHGDEPGKVEGNPVFVYLDAFAEHGDPAKIEEYKKRYRKGKIKDVEVKEYLYEVLERFLEPVRQIRAEFEKQPGLVEKILREGTKRTRVQAQDTLSQVLKAMKMSI